MTEEFQNGPNEVLEVVKIVVSHVFGNQQIGFAYAFGSKLLAMVWRNEVIFGSMDEKDRRLDPVDY